MDDRRMENENTERKYLIIMKEARQEGGENWRNYVNKKKVKEIKKRTDRETNGEDKDIG